MSEFDRAELLERFKDMTGTKDDFAISFLESTDWQLDPAIELFLGGQGGVARSFDREDTSDVEEQGSTGASGTATSSRENEIMRIMEQHSVDYDTAVAISEAGGSASGAPAVDADGVRAPILQKRARLFDNDDDDHVDNPYIGGMPTAFEAHMRIARDALMQGAARHRFEERPRLSSFAPPHWMMFAGSFEEARNEAKQKKRWLLVNIQDQPEFQSLVLNRDLWSDETIQDLIRGSFVFWQQDRTAFEAQRFLTLYNPSPPFPHVCIIDPRTGERARVLKLRKHEQELRDFFIDQISDYLDTSVLDPSTRRPKAVQPISSSSSASVAPRSARNTSPTRSDYSEEDEKALAEAIAASLHVSEETRPSYLSANTSSQTATKKSSPTIPPLPPLEAEPANSDLTTLIQIKFPDGSRVRRRFNKANLVNMIFAFVASTGKLDKDARFDLTTSEVPARSLLPLFSQSLTDADVCQQSLLVRVLE